MTAEMIYPKGAGEFGVRQIFGEGEVTLKLCGKFVTIDMKEKGGGFLVDSVDAGELKLRKVFYSPGDLLELNAVNREYLRAT